MQKATMFVGSSSEGLAAARAIKEQFDLELDVTIWNEGVFKLNTSTLESLLRAASFFDFAVLVITPDDSVTGRGKTQSAPRDNVVFEHGLFLGQLGPGRAFIVCEEATKVLSDYAGITIATYRERDDKNFVAAVGTSCNQIRTAIVEELKRPAIGVLPSTALAVGYFENFVTKVVQALGDERELAMKRKVKDSAAKVKIERRRLVYDAFTLHIVVPNKLSEITKESLPLRVSNLVQISIETGSAISLFTFGPKTTTPIQRARSPPSIFQRPCCPHAARTSSSLATAYPGWTRIRSAWSYARFETLS